MPGFWQLPVYFRRGATAAILSIACDPAPYFPSIATIDHEGAVPNSDGRLLLNLADATIAASTSLGVICHDHGTVATRS